MTAVLVTRPAGAVDGLTAELESRGYRVVSVPTVATRPIAADWPELARYDWIVLTSAAGVATLPEIPDGPAWAAVGEATARALRARGATVDVVPHEANGQALAEALPDPAGRRILLVRASMAAPDLPAALRARGARVDEVTAYETVEGPEESAAALAQALRSHDLAAVLFASGSAVRGFVKLGGGTRLPAVTIGPRTSAAARQAGFIVAAEATAQDINEMAAAVDRSIHKPSPAGGRPRRLRSSPALRGLVRETWLHPGSFVAPLFVVSGRAREQEIASLKGHRRMSPDVALAEAHRLAELGVGGILLFGIPDSKDATGSGAEDPRGPVAETLRLLRREGLPLALIADVCLCEYTSHGHCGILDGDQVDNDATLIRLTAAAIAYAEAGADIVGPSAMMDGQVAALRTGLDGAGLPGTAILAYSSKHASSLYAPFREAAGSTPSFGDRKSYQMDPANGREALREMQLDAAEGADMLMVKPAITSLDLLAEARRRFDLPLAAYQVSGEAAMLEAAAEKGWLDRRKAILETLTAIARAGAGITITYFAADASAWLREAR